MTTHEVALSMLGTGFRVATNDARIADLVRLFWEPFLVAGASEGAKEVSVEHAEDRWQMTFDGRGEGIVLDPWILGVTLRNLLTNRAIHAADHIVPLHSSVVEKDGVFLVLAGPSRAGKTTLMLELLEAGWLYVSDDLAPIDKASATAFPFPKALQVRDPARWRAFTAGWEVPEWLPPPGISSLVPPSALARTAADSYRPDVLLFSRYEAGAGPSFEPLSPAQAMLACGENLQREDAVLDGGLSRLGAWTAGARSARIGYGTTADALALLEEALGGRLPS